MSEPQVTRYWTDEVDLPEPMEHDRIVADFMAGRTAPPAGRATRRRVRVVVEGEGFPMGESPFEVTVGGQALHSLRAVGDGGRLEGFADAAPRPGDTVAFHLADPDGGGAPRVLVAGVIAPELLDEALA